MPRADTSDVNMMRFPGFCKKGVSGGKKGVSVNMTRFPGDRVCNKGVNGGKKGVSARTRPT